MSMRMRDLITIVEREQPLVFQQAMDNLRRAKQTGGDELARAQQQAYMAAKQLPVFQQAKALHLVNTLMFGQGEPASLSGELIA